MGSALVASLSKQQPYISTMNFIVDDIGSAVAYMRLGAEWSDDFGPDFKPFSINYMYGHRAEIADRLRAMTKDAVNKDKKYPLVALRMDIPEQLQDGVYQYILNVALITFTDKKYNAVERMTRIFKPKLYPLYYDFMRALKVSGLFMWPNGQEFPEHVKIDRPFWGVGFTDNNSGSQPGSTAQLFDDPVDAIEIVNLKLNKRFKTC